MSGSETGPSPQTWTRSTGSAINVSSVIWGHLLNPEGPRKTLNWAYRTCSKCRFLSDHVHEIIIKNIDPEIKGSYK